MSKLKIGLNLVGREFWLAGVTTLDMLIRSMALLAEKPEFYLVVTPKTLQDYPCHAALRSAVAGVVFLGPKPVVAEQTLGEYIHAPTAEDLFGMVDVLFPLNSDVLPGLPAISWIPDCQHIHLPELFSPAEMRWRQRTFQAVAEQAGFIYFMSAAVERDFRKQFPACRAQSRTVFFRILPEASWYAPEPEAVRNRYQIPADYIICCNQFWAHKNHALLYRALGLLKQAGISLHLVCTGNKTDYRNLAFFDSLQELAAELGIVDQLHITGPLPRQDQLQLIRASRFAVQPSSFEGFSLSVAECRALGKEILLSDLPVHREHGYGVLVDTASAEAWAQQLREMYERTRPGPDLAAETKASDASLALARQFAQDMDAMFRDAVAEFDRLRSRLKFRRLAIATSLAPRGVRNQQQAVNSWLAQGFRVVSLNAADEVTALQRLFPDVEFVPVTRDARGKYGKPYVYFDDFLAYFRECGDPVCGIVNSDVHLLSEYALPAFFAGEAKDGLVFGSRIDVKSLGQRQGSMYHAGFDFFFFDRKLLELYPAEEFCIGQPWWDYWLPLMALNRGVPVKRLMTPVAFHLKHPVQWQPEVRTQLGLAMAKHIPTPTKYTADTIQDFLEYACGNIRKRAQNIEIGTKRRRSPMTAKIPIIFCHRGNSDYLQYSLLQARRTNPDAPILLFGDESNNCYPFVTHLKAESSRAAQDFAANYVHLSVNPPDYELYCFLRWFMILGHCARHKIRRFFYVDSDVMLYTDVNRAEFQEFAWGMTGHNMAMGFFTTDLLKEFCLYLINQYRDAAVVADLREEFRQKQQAGQAIAISDMLFAARFVSAHPDVYQDLSAIRHGSAFNENIRSAETTVYAAKGKIAGIILVQGIPYLYHQERQQWVKLHSIHCQGPDLKPLMKILWEAPAGNAPEQVWTLDEHWQWQEAHLLEVLGGMPQKLRRLQEQNVIDPLEQKALLLGYNKLLGAFLTGADAAE